MKDFCILVQGPLNHYERLKSNYNNYDLVFSTWENDKIINDKVIYNKIPSETGLMNSNLQRLSTLNGLLKCKEIGYKYIFKTRSDAIVLGFEKLLKQINFDVITYFSYHHHYINKNFKGYFYDGYQFGEVNDLIKLWTNDEFDLNLPSEVNLTKNIYKKNLPYDFFFDKFDDEINIFWIKRNFFLSDYKYDKNYTTNKNEICIYEE